MIKTARLSPFESQIQGSRDHKEKYYASDIANYPLLKKADFLRRKSFISWNKRLLMLS